MMRILVAFGDETYSRSATAHAIKLAQSHNAHLTAIGIVDLAHLHNVGPIPVGGASAAHELRAARLKKADQVVSACAEEFASECAGAQIPFSVLREVGSSIRTLIEASRAFDLLICGLGGMFQHGIVDEPRDALKQLVEAGVYPLLAVGTAYRDVHRVLVAYSGSTESASTLRLYAQMQLYPHAETRVVHFGEDDEQGHELLGAAQAYLAAHGIEASVELIGKEPKEGLLPTAEAWGADLIVVGNSAKSVVRRYIWGETALSAMRSSPIPLFLAQ